MAKYLTEGICPEAMVWEATTQKGSRAGELSGERETREWLMCPDDVTQQHGRESLSQRA